MAFRHGRFAEITINGSAMSTFCDTMDLAIAVDTADTTTFLKSWKTAIAGLAGATLAGGGNYDPTLTTGPEAIMIPLIGADPFPVLAYPGGNEDSPYQQSRGFNAILTSFKESSKVGDKVKFDFTLLVTGAVDFESLD